jgi:hypothetical protein
MYRGVGGRYKPDTEQLFGLARVPWKSKKPALGGPLCRSELHLEITILVSGPIAVVVGIFWVRRIVSLVTKNYTICFRINWETCVSVHSVVVNTVYKIGLSKYAHGVGKLLLCSKPYKVNISCHCLNSYLLDLAAQ